MDRYASDVLENWTPPETDTHPDDCPRAVDDDGAPILRCPLVRAVNVHTMRMERMGGFRTREVVPFDGARVESSLEFGAIEGAGGTWWAPKSTAWSVEPSRIRALSPRGRAWLKATHARLAHYTDMGATDQNLAKFNAANRASHSKAGRATFEEAKRWNKPTAWVGVDASTGVEVLRLRDVTRDQAAALVDGYGAAGRPLVLRPA